MAEGVAVRTVQDLTVPEAGTYEIDSTHTVVEFVVRHLGLAKVRGRFNDFAGSIHIGEDPAESSVTTTIPASSIDTRNEDRDGHLRSGDFLDVDSHPTIEFRSTGVRREDDEWVVDGDLSIRGTSRSVTLAVEFEGGANDPWGNQRIGFSATTEIDREDFGLTWNQALETGGWLVGKRAKNRAIGRSRQAVDGGRLTRLEHSFVHNDRIEPRGEK